MMEQSKLFITKVTAAFPFKACNFDIRNMHRIAVPIPERSMIRFLKKLPRMFFARSYDFPDHFFAEHSLRNVVPFSYCENSSR